VLKKRRHNCKEINEFFVIENVMFGSLLSVRNNSWLFDELKAEFTADLQISLLKCWLRLKKIIFSLCKC